MPLVRRLKLLVEEDINNNQIQQSLLDAIRCFTMRVGNAMKYTSK